MSLSHLTTSHVTASSSLLRARFAALGGRTTIERLREAGALRLRRPRGDAFEGIIVNTSGGIVGGDRLAVDFEIGRDADVTLTSVAAEKIYRSAGPGAEVHLSIRLEANASLDWLPQDTILFEGCRLRRRVEGDVAPDARLLMVETMVFGRLASRETSITGSFADSWRVRRGGRLIFAEESRLEGALGALLDRSAIGGGARAAAILLLVAQSAEHDRDRAREALAPFATTDPLTCVDGGVSAGDGFVVTRLVAHSPKRLRASMIALLAALRTKPPPRIWA